MRYSPTLILRRAGLGHQYCIGDCCLPATVVVRRDAMACNAGCVLAHL